MNDFVITTDSGCDLNKEELDALKINVIPFKYNNDKETFEDSMNEKDYKVFYDQMRKGTIWKTSQINSQEYFDFFKQVFSQSHKPILHISLGSGVSNTVNSLNIAVNELAQEGITVKVIDSKLASCGEGCLVNKAYQLAQEGKSIDDTFSIVQEEILHINVLASTNTISYLGRSGRMSKVEAFIENALRINPVLDINPSGNLRVLDRCHGYNNALKKILCRIKTSAINPEEQTLYLAHADNYSKCEELAKILVEECHFKDYKVSYIGPIVGAHTGPGLICIFYYGKERCVNANYDFTNIEPFECK